MATPLCPYFGICGGCSFQHVDYAEQLAQKRAALSSASGLEDVTVIHGNQYNYRNRLDMVLHANGVGFREKEKWWSVVDIEQCAISNHGINALLPELREYFKQPDYFDQKKKTGTLKHVVVRASRLSNSLSFVMNMASTRLQPVIDDIEKFATITSAENVLVSFVDPRSGSSVSDDYRVVKGGEMLSETYLGKKFWYHIQGFFQTNTEMAERMQSYVNDLLKGYPTSQAHLLDLYGGVGTFGIVNSDLFKDVLIVENVKQAIDAADKNITENKVTNTKAMVLDAKYLKRLEFGKPLYVITDPPRSGMDERTIEQLKKLKPELIIYISCNLKQLRVDIPKFKEYKVKSAALFDLFPHTPHSEAIVELVPA